MRKSPPVFVVFAAVCLVLAGCNKEPKPNKKGGFLVRNEKLIEIPAVTLETQFTAEGFALNYFTGDVNEAVRTGDYLILFGDYKPNALNLYQQKSGYYEQDTSKGATTDAITVGPIKGEKEMFKCRLTKPLAPGIYLLECTRGKDTVGFPFRIE
jgi:hypothetical protein